ncbi:MAG TPA: amidase [Gemmatimonadaceae bacterium]|nr:amidase [Gemmatimonadaceae bacterium]
MTDITRRNFVLSSASLIGAAKLELAHVLDDALLQAPGTIDDDLLEITIPRLHALYAERKYTVVQVTRWYVDRIARYDSTYRTIVHLDSAAALREAAAQDASGRVRTRPRPLEGVPCVIKSNNSINGLVTNSGWSGYVIPGKELVAPADAPVVARLRAAGAIILGQTNMPDFAASDTTISSVYGRTGNAYNPDFSPGGSSGGSATAVSANFAMFATGTDTGNSIRQPSGVSSLVGVLPTRGSTNIAGIHPLDWSLDNVGPLARTVEDAAIVLDVMRESSSRESTFASNLRRDALAGKRFGVPAFVLNEAAADAHADGPRWVPLDHETRVVFMRAVEELRRAGATVVIDDALLPNAFLKVVQAVNTSPVRGEGLKAFLRDYGPPLYHTPLEYALTVGSPIPAYVAGGIPDTNVSVSDAAAALSRQRSAAVAEYDAALTRHGLDGLVYPAVQTPSNDELIPLRSGKRSEGPHSETGWVNVLGVPAVVVPAGYHPGGMPFGLELSGRAGQDGALLSWAYAFEQQTKLRKPPVLVRT